MSPRKRTWRARALPGVILGILGAASGDYLSPWFLIFPAIVCGWWAAARVSKIRPVHVADRVSSAGAAGLLAAGIVEIGGPLVIFWWYTYSGGRGSIGWDSGLWHILFSPLIMLPKAGLALAFAVLGGLLPGPAASRS